MSNWGQPGVNRNNLVRITGVPGIPLYVRREVAPIFQALANQLPACRKPGAPPLASAGGYVKRYISGTRIWSNHSYGTAADFNPNTNPYKRGPLTTDFDPTKTRALCKQLGLRWGGDYTGKKDAMHFEQLTGPAAAARTIRNLKTTTATAPAYTIGATGQKVDEIEARLHLMGYKTLKLDGTFDPGTKTDLTAFQRTVFTNPKEHDGIAGPKTLKALELGPLKLPTTHHNHGHTLNPGQHLHPGHQLTSPNGHHRLLLQHDGNLVLYTGNTPRWATHIRGNQLTMQHDGNLVLYLTAGTLQAPAWWTHTTTPTTRLTLQDDGNLVLYTGNNRPTWATSTN